MLKAGAAAVDISPTDSQFLFGYPHVPRYSTGVHDPLFSSALYLYDGRTQVMFIANDIIFVGKRTARQLRERIQERTAIPGENIMITATHTHSGPKTVDYISNDGDPSVPKVSPAYMSLFEDRIVQAATTAFEAAERAEVGLAIAHAPGVGTNRRDPSGPADPAVPVLMVSSGAKSRACMAVCSMHPTVLHEDSTLVSGDFPGMARRFLQGEILGAGCPVLLHTGPAGNQSPRHVIREQTFGEAERLGAILGGAIAEAIRQIDYTDAVSLEVRRTFVTLPPRTFPSVREAEQRLDQATTRLARLQVTDAPRQEVRTAEVDVFGAEEGLTLARAAESGRLDEIYRSCLPAEIQAIRVGPWWFVGWPGEIFVEYGLAVKAQRPHTFIISLANGELQGYIATEETAGDGGYEALNALFAPSSGQILAKATLDLLAQ